MATELCNKSQVVKSANGGSNAYTFYLVVTLNSQSIANNTSNITVTHKAKSNGAYSFADFSTPASYIIVNGVTKKTTTVKAISTSGTYTIGTWTGDVTHGSNGKLTLSVDGQFKHNITNTSTYYYLPANNTLSYSGALPDLHTPPAITNLTFTESNSTLTNAGVAANIFVPYLSNKTATIAATFYDSATVSSTSLSDGSSTFSGTTLSVGMNYTNKALNYTASSNTTSITATVKDSLSGSSSKAFSFSVIPYVLPSLSSSGASIKRNGQTTGKVNLSLTGSFYNGKVGNTTNAITLSYAYWKVGATESTTYITIPSSAYTKSGNTITMTDWSVTNASGTVITDVASTSNYNFKIKAVDSFGKTSTITLVCPSGEYLMAKFKDRVDFKKITINGKELHPIGSVVVTSTNTNPSTDFGGTWTLVDKEFEMRTGAADWTNTNGSATINFSKWGHVTFIRISLTCDVAVTDSSITWGKVDLSDIGLNALTYSRQLVGGADGANGLGLFNLNDDGTLTTVDMNSKSGASSLASGAYFQLWFIDIALADNMWDSHCNKFYWKRTA